MLLYFTIGLDVIQDNFHMLTHYKRRWDNTGSSCVLLLVHLNNDSWISVFKLPLITDQRGAITTCLSTAMDHHKTTNPQCMETKQVVINKTKSRIWKRQEWVPPPSRCEDDRLKVFVKLAAAKSAKGETPRGHVCYFNVGSIVKGSCVRRRWWWGGGGDVVNSPMKLAQHFDGQPHSVFKAFKTNK